jgi:Cu/Zn superoxide dismutase
MRVGALWTVNGLVVAIHQNYDNEGIALERTNFTDIDGDSGPAIACGVIKVHDEGAPFKHTLI